ncbi:ArsC/Spx/MgsR family protein [Herminiimonas sp. NPDC097707]|uniref:ArsC/Spx/MgsR family protein n=1 Tax=Herminiimonas sp. NPDC097707 TaxID=3364007 RepID=UPI00383A3BDC
MLIIYHNPRCSKSRGALEQVRQFAAQHQLDLEIVDYQKTPLNLMQLTELHQLLQVDATCSVRDMVRDNETLFDTLSLQQADDGSLLQALAAHPQLLQRPIVRFNNRALIARPPELLDNFLQMS